MRFPCQTSNPEMKLRDNNATTATWVNNGRREGRVAGSSGGAIAVCRRLAGLLLAGAEFLQLLAPRGNLQALHLQFKAQLVADLVFEPLDLLALELDDLVAILADDVAVIGMIGVVRIIKLVVLAKVHLADQPAFGEE